MSKELYKATFEHIKVEDNTLNKVKNLVAQQPTLKKSSLFRKYSAIAACSIFVIAVGLLLTNIDNLKVVIPGNDKEIISTEGVDIPQIKLPEKVEDGVKMDMIGLVVYKGKIYTQTGTSIAPNRALELRGEKIGRTKSSINEWSTQKDYAIELASTIGEQDVYKVKGYDDNFRIMSYLELDGEVYVEFYECLNGIKVSSGEDVFGKLKMKGNVKTSRYEHFNSWNEGMQQYVDFNDMNVLNSFVNELKNTKPYSREELDSLFTSSTNDNTKFIYIELQDGSKVQLRLFKEGYIYYQYSDIFFKMDNVEFQKLWDSLT